MWQFRYVSCKTDLDLWMKPETRLEEKSTKLNECVPLKPGSVGNFKMYLGTKLKRKLICNGIWGWSMSLSKYV